MHPEIKINERFIYNAISDITMVVLKGPSKVATYAMRGRYEGFDEIPAPDVHNILELKMKLLQQEEEELMKKYSTHPDISASPITSVSEALERVTNGLPAYTRASDLTLELPSQILSNNSICTIRDTAHLDIKNLNTENIVLLSYIKELYGEFILNDLATEETLNAKQLTIKEWLDGKD